MWDFKESMRIVSCILIFGVLVLGADPCLAWLDPGAADVDVVLNSEDNQFAFYDGPSGQTGENTEWFLNNGARTAVRLKGYDDPSGFLWDLSAYSGVVVEEAELHLCLTSGSVINSLVVSTINAEWTEGDGWGSTASDGEPCWRWRSYPDGEWTFVGSDFSTASFGNFGTLTSFGYKHDDTFRQYSSGGYDWIAMKLDPSIVYAMVLDNYGIVVTDPRFGSENGNPRVYSSEQNASVQPRLYIKTSSQTDETPPGEVSNLVASAGEWNGEAVLSFGAPSDPDDGKAFGYTVRYATHGDFGTATDVERWRIPRPGSPGGTDRLLIENLDPAETYNFWVQPYDKVGNSADAVIASLSLPAAVSTPVFAQGDFSEPDPAGKSILGAEGKLNYWACSELAKVNPATGNRMEDGYAGSSGDDYKKANPVWDSGENKVTLRAARNQVVGFQVIVERLVSSLTNVSLNASDLSGPGDDSIDAAENIEFFKLHYVGTGDKYPDPAIPLFSPFATQFDIPSENNDGGVFQSIWADVYAPDDARPGTYTGTLTLGCDQLSNPVAIQLELVLYDTVLPDRPTFFVDLNGYGNKWSSEASRYQVFQLCHKHRMVPNTLPYGWSGSVTEDRAPDLSGAGPTRQIDDWTTFAANYGPFFDGTAFSPDHPQYPYHGPGEDTAIADFYTTGSEAWPVSIADATYGYDAAGMGHAYWNGLVDAGGSSIQTFWLESPDVMGAFPAGYATGTVNVWRQFAQYALDHDWTTAFQFYLNNKRTYSNTNSLWILEEQYVADDFRADAWFMGLCKQGWEAAGASGENFQWRIDTSTRWSQNWGQLSGICNLRVQGDGKDWNHRHDRYRRYTERLDESRWWYGTGPARTSPLKDHAAEFLEHWSHGLDGGLPYWTNYDDNWTTAEGDDGGEDATLSILMSGDDVPGHGDFDGRIATVRMKGMRFSQQLCELLNLLSRKTGWNRNLAARALSAAYGDNEGFGYDAYGGDEYTQLGIADLYRLQADVIASIEATVKIIYVQKEGDCNDNEPCENTIQDALDLAETGVANIVKVVQGDYSEQISLTDNCSVLLDCGYEDADYQDKTGVSTVSSLEIADGEMIVENLEIR